MKASRVPGYIPVGHSNVKSQPQLTKHATLNHTSPVQNTQRNGVGDPVLSTHTEAKRIWNHIFPFLPLSLDPTIFDTEVVRLLTLPLLQNVQWRQTWMTRRLDNDCSQIYAILMHVLGVERNAESGEKPCSACKRSSGPFEGCWVLPRSAAWESHRHTMCCANCLFIHRRNACSLKHSWERRCDTLPGEKNFPGTPPPVVEWAKSAANAGTSGQSKKRRLSSSDVNGEPLAHRRRFEQTLGAEDEESAAIARKLVTLTLPLSKKPTPPAKCSTRSGTSPQQPVEHSSSFPSTSSSALVMAGQATGDELLEMEDWEIAPGRIREDGADKLNSKSQLSTLMCLTRLCKPHVSKCKIRTAHGFLAFDSCFPAFPAFPVVTIC